MPATTLPAPTKTAKASKTPEPAAPLAPEPLNTGLLASPPTKDELSSSSPNKFPVEGPGIIEALNLLSSGVAEDKVDEVWREKKGGKKPDPKPDTTVEVTGGKPEAKTETQTERHAADIQITAETSDAELDRHIEDATRNLDAGKVKAFRALTFENRAQKRDLKRVPELEAKVKELEARPPAKDEEAIAALRKEMESYKRRLDEQETELGGVRIEKSKMYLDEVAKPMEEILSQFQEFSEAYSVPREDLISLAGLKGIAQDEKFEEITSGWTKRKADQLGALLDSHASVAKKQAEIRAKGKQGYDNWLAQTKEQEAVARAKTATERAEALPKVWSEAIESAAPFLKEKDGDAEWNDTLKRTREFVQQANSEWLSAQSQYEQTRLTAQAAILPMTIQHYEGELAKQQEEIARLTARISDMRASSATVGASGTVADEPPNRDDDDSKLTFSQKVEKMMAKGEVQMR